jgi:dolichyl-phosphate beta-glucosyltransferase
LRSLSVVVPAYNEENRLPETLSRIITFLNGCEYSQVEVIVVDDGSRDGTARLVEEKAQGDPRFKLLRNPGNRGKGYAVRHGMMKATGDWRLMTDADLSSPMDQLVVLQQQADAQNAAVAIGSRALNRKLVRKHQSWLREMGGRFFNLVMSVLTGLPFHDTQCGFKLYSAGAAAAIFPRQKLDGFSFDVEDVFIAARLGFKVIEVPVTWANVEGTKVTIGATARAFADLAGIRWNALTGKYRP